MDARVYHQTATALDDNEYPSPPRFEHPSRVIRYRELQADIVQEESSHTINFIKIDCSQLKAALVGHCSQWQAKLTGLLNQVRRSRQHLSQPSVKLYCFAQRTDK